MKRIITIVLIALAGVGLFAYPLVSNYLFVAHASTAAQDYSKFIDMVEEEKIEKALADAVTYNENLEGNPAHDPFLANSGTVMSENYAQMLNLDGKGTMGYISIPKIGVKLSIFHGTADETLQQGAGHLEGSSLPIGGVGTHTVITGHTGLVHAKMFTDLAKLVVNDVFYLHVLNKTLAYKVDKILTVLPEETDELKRVQGQDYCTLVTCTPYGVNTHRLFVRGVRTAYSEKEEIAQAKNGGSGTEWLNEKSTITGVKIGLAVFAATAVTALALRKLSSRKRRDAQCLNTKSVGGARKNPPKSYWWQEVADTG
ncbi:MAG: class C sortase [Clostridium sp.]|nr:class C sortase [Clostridium sp.]